MKNLFLHAKYIAMKEDADLITMDHITKAVENMSLGDSKLKNDVFEYLEKYLEEKIDNDFGSLF